MPNQFYRELPMMSQFVLGGDKVNTFKAGHPVWRKPFTFNIEPGLCHVVMRNVVVTLPLSEDPRLFLARNIRIVPSRYKLRPNFEMAFE